MKWRPLRCFVYLFFLFCVFVFSSCSSGNKKEVALYQTHCGSCHLPPAIEGLPKHIWKNNVLPEMGARLGIRDNGYDPLKDLHFGEQAMLLEKGIYPYSPMLDIADWELLRDYIINMAPDSLPKQQNLDVAKPLRGFAKELISLDDKEQSLFTYLEFDENNKSLLLGDLKGYVLEYDIEKDTLQPKAKLASTVVDHYNDGELSFTTSIGSIRPTALSTGQVYMWQNGNPMVMPIQFHRPVHTVVEDLNNDGKKELIVSEFGDLTGSLSLLLNKGNSTYEKKILLNQPGVIRVVVKDMNQDQRKDLVAITSQGDEGVTILYQQDDLSFEPEKVIRFSPLYGSSWFELIDYDGDGDDDIIIVNGDNADESYVQKPYHGMRIHLNNGENQFKETYFYPMNGASRVVAHDFDQDGDIDFGLISTFPDYATKPDYSFVYLENKDTANFVFDPHIIKDPDARWFLMDTGDIDEDGDMDIILSAFTYAFTPVPDELTEVWKEKKVDLMILRNQLMDKMP